MAKKWIITKEHELRIGDVAFHGNLVNPDYDGDKDKPTNILGGGKWMFVQAENSTDKKTTLWLWGMSMDFGVCKLEDVIKAKQENYRSSLNCRWMFSDRLEFDKESPSFNQPKWIEITKDPSYCQICSRVLGTDDVAFCGVNDCPEKDGE